MKITGVKTTLFNNLPPACGRDHEVPRGPSRNACCLVELATDSGLTGIGFAAARARPAIQTLARDVLIGEDPRAAAALWQRTGEQQPGRGDGMYHHARAVLDLAVWDLKAKAQNEPLWKTLGGTRPRANAYASWTVAQSSDKAIAKWFGVMSRDFGLAAGKLPVGEDLEADLRRLGQVRDVLSMASHAPELMIDAGGRWWPSEAIRCIRRMEKEFDLSFVQRIAHNGDFLGAKHVADSIRAAVCVGGELATGSGFLPYFHHHAANVIEIDLRQMGITGALQIADAAYGFELPVTMTAATGNIHVHLAAVMPNFMSMEVIEAGPGEGIIASDVRFESGRGIAGDAAGHGLTVSPERLAKATLDTED